MRSSKACWGNNVSSIDDLRISKIRPLITPAKLARELPATEQNSELVAESRSAIVRILDGKDNRQIVIVGPCSIHDPDAATEYALALKQQTSSGYRVFFLYHSVPSSTL